MPAVVAPANLGADFDIGNATPNKINVVAATTTTGGKVSRLATASDISAGTSGPVVDAAGLKSALSGVVGSLNFQGAWNPVTNTPQLLSGQGTKGFAYKLSQNGVSISTTAASASTSTAISVASSSGIVPGQSITGAGVPAGTTVVSVSGTTVTASAAVNIASTAALTFATFLDGSGPFYAGDTVTFDGSTYDKFDGAAETSVNVTDAFGAHLYYAAP